MSNSKGTNKMTGTEGMTNVHLVRSNKTRGELSLEIFNCSIVSNEKNMVLFMFKALLAPNKIIIIDTNSILHNSKKDLFLPMSQFWPTFCEQKKPLEFNSNSSEFYLTLSLRWKVLSFNEMCLRVITRTLEIGMPPDYTFPNGTLGNTDRNKERMVVFLLCRVLVTYAAQTGPLSEDQQQFVLFCIHFKKDFVSFLVDIAGDISPGNNLRYMLVVWCLFFSRLENPEITKMIMVFVSQYTDSSDNEFPKLVVLMLKWLNSVDGEPIAPGNVDLDTLKVFGLLPRSLLDGKLYSGKIFEPYVSDDLFQKLSTVVDKKKPVEPGITYSFNLLEGNLAFKSTNPGTECSVQVFYEGLDGKKMVIVTGLNGDAYVANQDTSGNPTYMIVRQNKSDPKSPMIKNTEFTGHSLPVQKTGVPYILECTLKELNLLGNPVYMIRFLTGFNRIVEITCKGTIRIKAFAKEQSILIATLEQFRDSTNVDMINQHKKKMGEAGGGIKPDSKDGFFTAPTITVTMTTSFSSSKGGGGGRVSFTDTGNGFFGDLFGTSNEDVFPSAEILTKSSSSKAGGGIGGIKSDTSDTFFGDLFGTPPVKTREEMVADARRIIEQAEASRKAEEDARRIIEQAEASRKAEEDARRIIEQVEASRKAEEDARRIIEQVEASRKAEEDVHRLTKLHSDAGAAHSASRVEAKMLKIALGKAKKINADLAGAITNYPSGSI